MKWNKKDSFSSCFLVFSFHSFPSWHQRCIIKVRVGSGPWGKVCIHWELQKLSLTFIKEPSFTSFLLRILQQSEDHSQSSLRGWKDKSQSGHSWSYLGPTLVASPFHGAQGDPGPLFSSPDVCKVTKIMSSLCRVKTVFSSYRGEINEVALSGMSAELPPVSWRAEREKLAAGSHMPSVKLHQTASICMFVFFIFPFPLCVLLRLFFIRLLAVPFRVCLCVFCVYPSCRHLLPRI